MFMPKKSKPLKPPKSNPGMVMVVTFFILLVVNTLIVYAASWYFPKYVVLGTSTMNPTWAVIHSMGFLALIDTFALPFIREIEKFKGRMLTSGEWMLKYFLLNFAGIWIITRFSEQFGLGIAAWWVALVLAAVLDVVQGLVMMQVEKMRVK
jgi:hypothetical protein